MKNLDKLYHFGVGFLIAILLTVIENYWVAMINVVVIAGAKEVYDYSVPEKHTSDGADFIATIVGGLVGIVLSTKLCG